MSLLAAGRSHPPTIWRCRSPAWFKKSPAAARDAGDDSSAAGIGARYRSVEAAQCRGDDDAVPGRATFARYARGRAQQCVHGALMICSFTRAAQAHDSAHGARRKCSRSRRRWFAGFFVGAREAAVPRRTALQKFHAMAIGWWNFCRFSASLMCKGAMKSARRVVI